MVQEDVLRRTFSMESGVLLTEAIVLETLNQRLLKAGKDRLQTLEGAKKLQEEITKQMKTFSGIEQAVKLETVLQVINSISTINVTREALESLIGIKARLEDLEKTLTRGFSVEVLEHGKTWIIEGVLNDCPLCEQQLVDRDATLARIEARVKECTAVIETKRSLDSQTKLFRDSLIELGKSCAAAQKIWSEKLGQEPAGISEALSNLRKIASDTSKPLSSEELKSQLQVLDSVNLESVVRAAIENIQGQLKALGGIEEYKNLSSANQALSSVAVTWPVLLAGRNAVRTESDHKKVLDRLISHAVQARKDTVQTIVVGIADEANRIYRELHPNEKVGPISLSVPARGQGSVDMHGEFFGRKSDARVYFSESHLDTLGVALFLALRKKQAQADPGFKLLVLDDVFHSVDSNHRHRAARLIIREFKDHQFIITTHDPIWFTLLQEAVNDIRIREQVIFRRIADWTLERGPAWGEHDAEYAFLTSTEVDKALPADIAARAGRLLEEMLKPLCDQLRIAVPFRYQRRVELGAIWPPFKKAALEHNGFSEKHRELILEIDTTDWVRNETGAHSNLSPAPTTAPEAKRFAAAVVKLYLATRSSGCGRFIQEVDAPKGDWNCKCGTIRYEQNPSPTVPKGRGLV